MGPGHSHNFVGPSCSYTENTSGVFAEAKEMMSSNTPTKAKPTVPGGCSSWEEFTKQCEEAFVNAGEKFIKNSANYICNIFPSETN